MKHLLAVLLLVSFLGTPTPAASQEAALVADLPGGRVVLRHKPCTNLAILAHIEPSWHSRYKEGAAQPIPELVAQGLPPVVALCWNDNEAWPGYFVVAEDGSSGTLSREQFTE